MSAQATFPALKVADISCPCCSCSYWANGEGACELKEARAEAAKVVAERDRYRVALEWIVKHWGYGEDNLRDVAAEALKDIVLPRCSCPSGPEPHRAACLPTAGGRFPDLAEKGGGP